MEVSFRLRQVHVARSWVPSWGAEHCWGHAGVHCESAQFVFRFILSDFLHLHPIGLWGVRGTTGGSYYMCATFWLPLRSEEETWLIKNECIRGKKKRKINGYNNGIYLVWTLQWHQGHLCQQRYDGLIKMIEAGLQRATVQISGQQANMNHSQDTDVTTLNSFI